jgi:hypothetical protein
MLNIKQLKNEWQDLKALIREELLRLEWMYFNNKNELNDPIFFIHLPKTAGTSFRMMLFKKVLQSEVYPNIKDITDHGGNYPNLAQARNFLQNSFRQETKLLIGHYPYAFKELIPKNFKVITFLREPIDRTISNLQHFKRSRQEDQHLSLSAIFDKYQDHLSNFQTRYICDNSMANGMYFYHQKDLNEQALIQSKINLENCDLVGITERFKDSIYLAEQLLGCKLGKPLKKNVNKAGSLYDIEPNLVNKLKPHLELDILLYEHAMKLFETKLKSVQ